MNAYEQLVRCASAQGAARDFAYLKVLPCTACGEPMVEPNHGPKICATCAIRRSLAAA